MAGINIVHGAYKGVGLAVNDLLAGRVHMMFPNAGAALQHVKLGKLRALAVGSSPAGLTAHMKSEMARLGKVIKAANIRAE